MRRARLGYDLIPVYKLQDLRKLYEAEGRTPSDDEIKSVYRALNQINSAEREMWQKKSEHEVLFGLIEKGE